MTSRNPSNERKTIVVSAVNLVEAGTLAILRECLAYLSSLADEGGYRIVAVVYKRSLTDFPNIEYIETQWPKKRWVNRLWFEYVSMKKLSYQIGDVFLWLSLHDTTPTVKAQRRAVYCHNSFSFYRWKMHDWVFAPRIATFALMTKYIYKPNIGQNRFLVVQQEWFREAMAQMFSFPTERIVVAPPARTYPEIKSTADEMKGGVYSFIFAASPNSHKNFECICQATEILVGRGVRNFKVKITVAGNENKYARWLFKRWGNRFSELQFVGFLTRSDLEASYQNSNCLIFPSKVETWGLPISEFAVYNKPMLLADLPYAHETASGASQVAFFNPDKPAELAALMHKLINGDPSPLKAIDEVRYAEPYAGNWAEMFRILLND